MRKVLPSIGLFLLIGTTAWYSASEKSISKRAQLINPDAPVIIDIVMTDRVIEPTDLIVYQDQEVTLRIKSNETGELHIAGYELFSGITQSKISKMTFAAGKQGHFSIEFHPLDSHEDIHTGFLSVLPR
ncbi:MAG: hypothetical protein O2904_03640 [bacterium]|nr:hypothetical protein [bacterium]